MKPDAVAYATFINTDVSTGSEVCPAVGYYLVTPPKVATIRKRLGHKKLQTTLLYAEQADSTADTEVRAWRRRFGG